MRRLSQFAVAMAVSACLGGALTADTIHVPADQPTIQAGIDAAINGDVVLVAPGTYSEAINFMGKAITMQSSDGADMTVIDATGFNASVVSFINGEGPGSVLHGFTITGGTGTLVGTIRCGGGVYMMNSSPVVSSCIVHTNNAGQGGGAYASGGTPHALNCTLTLNTAVRGGGFYPTLGDMFVSGCVISSNGAAEGAGMFVSQGAAHVTACVFDENDISGCYDDAVPPPSFVTGGGIRTDQANLTVEDCMFTANCGTYGGSAISVWGNTCTVRRTTFRNHSRDAVLLYQGQHLFEQCKFEDNSMGVRIDRLNSIFRECEFRRNAPQGAMRIVGGIMPIDVEIHGCVFEQNSAETGGAIHSTDRRITLQVSNSSFEGNSATGEGDPKLLTGGGAISVWGGDTTVVNSAFIGNAAIIGHGGAVLQQGQFLNSTTLMSLVNCTIAGNTADMTLTGGVVNGPAYGPSTLNVANCILWNNQSTPVETDPAASTTIAHSNVQGGAPGGGVGNIDIDPMFVSATDLQLTRGSPCINAGDNASIPAGVTTDLAGNPRVQGGIVDMGAFEFHACWGDISPQSGNGAVDIDDLLAVINAWGWTGAPWSIPGDTNGDGLVNVDDLLTIINFWGSC